MCFAVYIGTNEKQQISEWKENETLIYFNELTEDDQIVKKKFTKANVYYVGANTGCSCGFAWEIENFSDPEEQESKKSPQKLIDFIKEQTKKEDLEFYCCWEGDWDDKTEENIELNIHDVSLDKYYFMEEKRFIVFKQQE
ncbi:MAG: hypothetical protein JWN83_2068 [Chitinophagaceae bacterium]|nr:hypothetical protein [Chitinophagaceae bacterium]